MDVSRVQRHQDIMASQSLDSMLVCTKPQNQQQEKKPRPSEESLKCPRCDSSNTKFCYYNNYSLTQPRYFCKSCRRYWTKGGTLRNVPVGGGCRKNKRCSSSSRRSSTPDHHLQHFITSPTSTTSQQFNLPLTSYEHYSDVNGSFGNMNIPILGHSGNTTHFDLFGNHFNGGLLDSLRNGFVNHDKNDVNMYYGANLGVNNLNHEEHHHSMGMHFDLLQLQNHQDVMSNPSSGSSTPTIKQEVLGDNNNNRGLLSYIMTGGGAGGGGGEIDAHRESWNAGVLGSSWHNLINSPLM